ncbi:MAG: hypothetical protein LBR80_13555 [Deltaproteobacteria bacterium]|nr:hypothetical protein [Deltaproteobacteria bacterium]
MDDIKKPDMMDSVKVRVLETDDGQIIKLPKDFHVKFNNFGHFSLGNDVLLKAPVKNNIAFIFDRLEPCPDDFLEVIRGEVSQGQKTL